MPRYFRVRRLVYHRQSPVYLNELSNDEDAVSPVIGVILMVAITVIMAAVIGTFVLDIGSSINKNVQAAAIIDFDSNNEQIGVTFASAQEKDTTLSVTITNMTSDSDELDTSLSSIGNSVTHDGTDGTRYTVTVIGVNGDRETVVQTKTDTL